MRVIRLAVRRIELFGRIEELCKRYGLPIEDVDKVIATGIDEYLKARRQGRPPITVEEARRRHEKRMEIRKRRREEEKRKADVARKLAEIGKLVSGVGKVRKSVKGG